MKILDNIKTLRWDCKSHKLKYFDSATKEGDKAVVFVEDLQNAGKDWIKHFMDRFDITPEYLPTKVRLAPYGEAKYTYGKTTDEKNSLLTWTMKKMPKKGIDQIMPGLSSIAFIKYYFGIKDGEELE